MGYYSLYKILKDIIYTFIRLFKKSSFKIITIIIVFIAVFVLYSFYNKTSAHVDYYEYIQTFTEGRAWALYTANNGNIYLVVSPTDLPLSYSGADSTTAYFMYSPSNSTNNIKPFNYYLKNADNTFSYIYTDYGYNNAFGIGAINIDNARNQVLDINRDILYLGSNEIAWYVSDFSSVNPYIENETTTIDNWTFDYFNINGGTISPYFELNNNTYPYLFDLKIIYNNTTYYLDIQDYVTINQNANTFNISIPKDYLTTSFNVVEDSNFTFTLELNSFDNNGDINNTTYFDLGSYSFILSTAQVQTQNNDSQRFLENQNNNNLNNINNSLNNSDINPNNIDSFNNIDNNLLINDNSSINTIFNNIYNAFVTKYNDNNIGYGYTLSLPIPYTDKTIDISPHTIFGRSTYDLYQPENQYNYPGVQTIYRFVQTIWWFVIGMFVLKDVRNMINKIAEGNIEDVSSDVERELL